MVPYETRDNSTPRRVVIQRKRVQYAKQDINALLESNGFNAAEELNSKRPRTALHVAVFDNTDYESRTPQEWVPKQAGVPAAPAKVATFDAAGVCSWRECSVVDYNADKNMYVVRVGDAASTQLVHRVHLCFLGEDPEQFSKRMADAYASRARAESLLLYNLCIDCMPTEDVPSLSTEQINRMLGYALNSKSLRDKLVDTSQLILEVNTEYAHSMNKLAFDHFAKRGDSGCPASLLPFSHELAVRAF